MAYEVKGAPFVFKGVTDVSHCKSAAEVMSEAGLDWIVSKCELVAKMPININNKNNGFIHGLNNFVDCPNAYAIYRTDTNVPLGVVKERYTAVQNIEAFDFFDEAIGKNNAIWQTAGCFGNGERIFVSAKLPNNILVNGDPIENYLVFTNNHDGGGGVKILFTPIRIICQNTLNSAIKNATNYISFRHTKSIHEKIDVAAELLGICAKYSSDFEEELNFMNTIKFTNEQAADIFAKTILTKEELDRLHYTGHNSIQLASKYWSAIEDSEISMKKVNAIAGMNDYYHTGIGQREIIGTGYGVYNAISGFYSNVDKSTGAKRMDSLLYGDKSKKLQTAANMIIYAA